MIHGGARAGTNSANERIFGEHVRLDAIEQLVHRWR